MPLPSSPFGRSRDRADHGRRVYNRWSDHQRIYGALVRLAFLERDRAARERALSVLDLASGERVLDIGCGAGVNFDALGAQVGSGGLVVGLDYSEGMVRAARERTPGTPAPTAVCRGDATTLPFADGSFDAAYATLSLSAMATAETAVEEVSRVLRPGGRLAVVDARPFQAGLWRALNPLVTPISMLATNWYPEVDILGTIRSTFDESRVWTTNAGTLYVAVGWKEDEVRRDRLR